MNPNEKMPDEALMDETLSELYRSASQQLTPTLPKNLHLSILEAAQQKGKLNAQKEQTPSWWQQLKQQWYLPSMGAVIGAAITWVVLHGLPFMQKDHTPAPQQAQALAPRQNSQNTSSLDEAPPKVEMPRFAADLPAHDLATQASPTTRSEKKDALKAEQPLTAQGSTGIITQTTKEIIATHPHATTKNNTVGASTQRQDKAKEGFDSYVGEAEAKRSTPPSAPIKKPSAVATSSMGDIRGADIQPPTLAHPQPATEFRTEQTDGIDKQSKVKLGLQKIAITLPKKGQARQVVRQSFMQQGAKLIESLPSGFSELDQQDQFRFENSRFGIENSEVWRCHYQDDLLLACHMIEQ